MRQIMVSLTRGMRLEALSRICEQAEKQNDLRFSSPSRCVKINVASLCTQQRRGITSRLCHRFIKWGVDQKVQACCAANTQDKGSHAPRFLSVFSMSIVSASAPPFCSFRAFV